MAFLIGDNVRDTTTTTLTGDVTLALAVISTYVQFNSKFAVNIDWFPYSIRHQGANEWENGLGYLSASSTLVRWQVISSSNANALVSFSAGTKDVYGSMPADVQRMLNIAGSMSAKFAWR